MDLLDHFLVPGSFSVFKKGRTGFLSLQVHCAAVPIKDLYDLVVPRGPVQFKLVTSSDVPCMPSVLRVKTVSTEETGLGGLELFTHSKSPDLALATEPCPICLATFLSSFLHPVFSITLSNHTSLLTTLRFTGCDPATCAGWSYVNLTHKLGLSEKRGPPVRKCLLKI